MKLTIAFIIAIAAIAFFAQPEPACAYGGCGAMIPKPATPPGCVDLISTCQCDSEGKNCSWNWVCVRL